MKFKMTIDETLKKVFHYISKHLEMRKKYPVFLDCLHDKQLLI